MWYMYQLKIEYRQYYPLTSIYDWCKEFDNKELCNPGNKWHTSYNTVNL